MSNHILISPIFLLIIIALFGLIIGSFLNVIICRLPILLKADWYQQCKLFLSENYEINLPEKKISHSEPFNLMYPASHCPKCKTALKVIDNIPLISFCILKGQCRTCHHPISWRYPFIEASTAILSVLTAYYMGPFSLTTIFGLLLTWALITLTMIDLDQRILPDNITLPFLWLGLLININETFCSLSQALLGAVIGYLSLWCVYWIFKLITGKEGMGHGDFKLLAMLGAWIGLKGLLPIILISSCLGALVGITLILLKKHKKDYPIPFGPFLAFAGWFTFLFGNELIKYYLDLSGLALL